MIEPGYWLPTLLGLAVLLPLVSFFAILVLGARWMGRAGEYAAVLAVAAIGGSAVASFLSMGIWLTHHWQVTPHGEKAGHTASGHAASADGHVTADHAAGGHAAGDHAAGDHAAGPGHGDGHHAEPVAYAGEFNVPGTKSPWVLGQFGDLRLSISYYVDGLTVSMFCMVTLIATLIHIYAMGYMHDELHPVTDKEVATSSGEPFHRPGRYHRFFQYLSLFCFSMLGLVIAGSVAMVFVFWELVGICSYFLIGFYVERRSASTAANKAFIVNRVGDFGMIIGMMALWTGLGTLSFGEIKNEDGRVVQQSLFELVRPESNHRQLIVPDGLVALSGKREIRDAIRSLGPDATSQQVEAAVAARVARLRQEAGPWGMPHGYLLLLVGGIGIFAGCVGKSAQFPLHVWLPDAMEGPTPVSALVHSATMVAAGVYLVGRFYPVFVPEALLVIAIAGGITLFLAATIALTAVDIKRVLAYSTVSQLGYMMLSLGLGGWLAGMMHLITHAFFKSLLFMCSGSVIHAVHTNDMREMGGLRKKMPVTAYTMLVGCLAIAGAGIPFIVGLLGGPHLAGLGFSGFYSKDAILEQAYSFLKVNPSALSGVFFFVATGGAAMTAFYMFRLWYMTFAGTPRNRSRYDHAHESPVVMYAPLIILAVFAVSVAWSPYQGLMGGLAAIVVFALVKLFRKPAAEPDGSSASAGSSHAAPERAAVSHDDPSHGSHLPGHGHQPEHEHSHGHPSEHGHPGGRAAIPWGSIPLAAAVLIFVAALLVFSVAPNLSLSELLESARPAGTVATSHAVVLAGWVWPNEHDSHAPAIAVPVTIMAIGTALTGFLIATLMYGLARLSAEDVRRQFEPVYRLLWNKWWFDELYDGLFVRPTFVLSRFISGLDRNWIDGFVNGLAAVTKAFSYAWDRIADRSIVDGFLNRLADWTYSLGLTLREAQTGKIRQYVMFIVIGAVAIFVLISLWNTSLAG